MGAPEHAPAPELLNGRACSAPARLLSFPGESSLGRPVQQVKGAVLKSRIAFVEEQFGKDAVQQVLARLPAEDQRPFRLLFTSNWYPFELGKRLDDSARPTA